MKITKEMGKACLRELDRIGKIADTHIRSINDDDAQFSLEEIGWVTGSVSATYFNEDRRCFLNAKQVMTALAMCAAIAGVKP